MLNRSLAVLAPLALALVACSTPRSTAVVEPRFGAVVDSRFGVLDNCPYGYDSERDCQQKAAPVVPAAPAPAPAPVAVAEPPPEPPPAPAVEPPPPPAPAPAVEPPPPAPAPRVVVTDTKFELKEVVFFDTGKATIQPRSHSLLEEAAAAIKGHPEVKRILVEGHTDALGNKAFNTRLSQQRAEAVRKFLVEKGVEHGRLDAKGFGPTRPVADNKTPAGREKNRRVELSIE